MTWINGDGTFDDLSTAPEDVKSIVEAKKWTTVSEALKSYKEVESFAGGFKNKLNLPEMLDDASLSAIYTKLGRPEMPEKYEFENESDIPLDETLMGNFRKYAHGLNLTNKQFSEVVKFQVEAVKEAMAAQEKTNQETLTVAAQALKDEWKENYNGNFKKAKETAQKLEILDELEGLGLADNPRVIKLMHRLNSQLSEAVLTPKTPSASGMSPQQEMEEIKKSEAFRNRMHPDHKTVHARFLELCGVKKAG